MKILLTVPSLDPRFGGPLIKAHAMAAALEQRGHQVRIAGCGASAEGVIGLPTATRFHGTPIPIRFGPLFRAVEGADIVHVLGFRDPVGTLAGRRAQAVGTPYVVEPVGMHRRRIRSLRLKRLFDRTIGDRRITRSNMTIATSALEMAELIEDGIDPATIRVRPNGVSIDGLLPLPQPGAFRKRHGIPEDAKVMLSLGRITRKKGLLALVAAAEPLADTWVAIIGPDDGDGTLERLVAMRERMNGRLVLDSAGAWGADRAQLFADADAFCLPSASENFGIAPAEAAAAGLPVVISDRCGVVEFLDPEAMIAVPFGDISSLRRALVQASEPAAYEAAQKSAQTVRETLSWAAIAESQEQIYDEVTPARVPAMRVVITVPSFDPAFGGPAVQLEPMASALRAQGAEVTVVGCGEGREPHLVGLPIVARFHGTPVPRQLAPLFRAIDRADLVHVLGYRDPVGFAAALRAACRSVPVVLEPMGMHRPRVRSQQVKTVFDVLVGDRITAAAVKVIATSRLEADELADDGVDPIRIMIRPNGVDVEGLLPLPPRGSFRASAGIPDDEKLILFLGRITRKKGLPDLVEAAAATGHSLVVVGPDSHDGGLDDLHEAVVRAGVADKTFIDTRGVWGDSRAAVFVDADVFCLPSLTENFGNAAAEAAALGVPVVVSDRCGVAEYLPAVSSRIVPYGRSDLLAEAITWAVGPDVRGDAQAAAQDVRLSLHWNQLARDQVEAYQRIIADHRG